MKAELWKKFSPEEAAGYAPSLFAEDSFPKGNMAEIRNENKELHITTKTIYTAYSARKSSVTTKLHTASIHVK